MLMLHHMRSRPDGGRGYLGATWGLGPDLAFRFQNEVRSSDPPILDHIGNPNPGPKNKGEALPTHTVRNSSSSPRPQ